MPTTTAKGPTRRRRLARAGDRIGPIIEQLKAEYPSAKCSLNYENALELLVATILSAQCTDDRVNIVTRGLFQRYRSATAYAAAEPGRLEAEIKSTGFYRNKAKSIIGMAQSLVENHAGEVPETIEALVRLPGVGRKTANVVLGNAFGRAAGVVVDTHVTRISRLLGLTRHREPEKIERALNRLVPERDWVLFPHLMIQHGRAVCIARRPRCTDCALAALCPSAALI